MVRLALGALERLHALTPWLVPSAGHDGGPAALHADPAPGPVEHSSALGGGEHEAPDRTPPVLVAGRDSARRAILLKELTEIMPGSTVFEEVGAFSEVLEHAPSSRMVIFSGDLPDVPADSFTGILGRRHPRLPVVRLDAPPSSDNLCVRA
jgi:hypothetical protein